MNCVYEPETMKKTRKDKRPRGTKKRAHSQMSIKNEKFELWRSSCTSHSTHSAHTYTDHFFENVSYAFNENWKGKPTNKSKNQNKEEQKIHQRISSEQWRSLSQPERAHYAPKLIQMARTEGECERRTRKKGLD